MKRYKKHIIIVGSARSGTSWLAETMAKQFRYRSLFEPEHEFQTKKGHLLCDKWVREEDKFKDGNRYLHNVFSNRVNNDWIAQNSNRKWKRHLWPFIPKKFIIKFVRCNLLAHYINSSFGIPVIHLIRNPYDVISSQQRVKFPWLFSLEHFYDQPHLIALLKQEFDFDLNETENYSNTQKLAVRWCLENVIPITIQKAESETYRVIRYEDIKSNIDQYKELCSDFNIEPIASLDVEYIKPSSKTHPKSEIRTRSKGYDKLSEAELTEINTILNTFKAHFYPRKHK